MKTSNYQYTLGTKWSSPTANWPDDGQTIDSFADLNSYLVYHTQVGQVIDMTILRDGEQVELQLTLDARP